MYIPQKKNTKKTIFEGDELLPKNVLKNPSKNFVKTLHKKQQNVDVQTSIRTKIEKNIVLLCFFFFC